MSGPHINPWRLWTGAFVPEWLMPRVELSPGAKLAYARLCRFAGKNGVAWPHEWELGEELGVGERQARRYVAELSKYELVDVQRRGRGESNLYRFPRHGWMGLDDDIESASARPDTSDPSRPDTVDRSGEDTSDRRARTHPAALERTDRSAPFLTESVVESHEESHRSAGPSADASKHDVPINEHACWRALIDALGAKPETKSERGRFATAVRQLIDIDATASEIRSRVAVYRRKWPTMAITPTAIVAHWSELTDTPAPTAGALRLGRADCAACDSTGFVTAAGRAVQPCPACNPQHAEASS